MKKNYKVWIEIEELDAKGNPTGNDVGILPDSLGTFPSLKQATAKVAKIVKEHGIDPENSDSVKVVAKTGHELTGGGRARMRLAINVSYDLYGCKVASLEQMLNDAASHLANEGLLSGTTEAEVTEWDGKVEELQ
ncbi:MAG: hypothetical protein WCJ63_08405 [Actinomycetes bacterium]